MRLDIHGYKLYCMALDLKSHDRGVHMFISSPWGVRMCVCVWGAGDIEGGSKEWDHGKVLS